MFNSFGRKNSDKSLCKCSLLKVSNAFVISSSKTLVEWLQDVNAFSRSIFIARMCSVVLLLLLYAD